MKIPGTLGGHRNGYIGAPLEQGSLGARKRLPGAPPPPMEEPTEYDHADAAMDAIRTRLREQERAEIAKEYGLSVGLPPEDHEGTMRQWGAAEVYYVVRWYRVKTNEQIAEDLGRTLKSVHQKVCDIRKKFASEGVLNGNKGTFRRTTSLETEAVILKMAAEGKGRVVIARKLGLTEGRVRQVIHNPRPV